MASTDILNTAMLEDLRSVLGKDKLAHLIKEFIGHAHMLIAQLSSIHDYQVIFEKAHEIKGMSANYGFKELSALAKTLEDTAKEEGDLSAPVQNLVEANIRAQGAIKIWLKSAA